MRNYGNGYDFNTGIFQAPVAGSYIFTVQLCPLVNRYIVYNIMVDEKADTFIHTLIQKLKSVARVTQSCFWRQEVGCGLKSWTVAPKFSKMAIDHSTLLAFWLMFHVNNCFDVSKLYMYEPHGLKMNTSF